MEVMAVLSDIRALARMQLQLQLFLIGKDILRGRKEERTTRNYHCTFCSYALLCTLIARVRLNHQGLDAACSGRQ